MIEEVGAAGAALELLGDDGVLGRGVDAASPALEHPVPVQSLHEQQPHPPQPTPQFPPHPPKKKKNQNVQIDDGSKSPQRSRGSNQISRRDS